MPHEEVLECQAKHFVALSNNHIKGRKTDKQEYLRNRTFVKGFVITYMVFSFGKSPNGTFSVLQRKENVTNTVQNSEVNILFG